MQLAKALGLDTSNLTGGRAGGSAWDREDDAAFRPRKTMPDNERFAGAEPLLVRCLWCNETGTFSGSLVATAGTGVLRSGLFCTRAGCGGIWGSALAPQPVSRLSSEQALNACEARLSNAVTMMVRSTTSAYQAGWMVCEDSSCSTRTRAQSRRDGGMACPRAGCSSRLRAEKSAAAVHLQLEYLANLFNIDRVYDNFMAAYKAHPETSLSPPDKPEVSRDDYGAEKLNHESPRLPLFHYDLLKDLHKSVSKYLVTAAYHTVQTAPLFAYVDRMNRRRDITVQPMRFRAEVAAVGKRDGVTGAGGGGGIGAGAFSTPAKTRSSGSSLSALGASYSVDGGVSAAALSAARVEKLRRLNSGTIAVGGGLLKEGGFMALKDDAS